MIHLTVRLVSTRHLTAAINFSHFSTAAAYWYTLSKAHFIHQFLLSYNLIVTYLMRIQITLCMSGSDHVAC